jgi:hypothetical protein
MHITEFCYLLSTIDSDIVRCKCSQNQWILERTLEFLRKSQYMDTRRQPTEFNLPRGWYPCRGIVDPEWLLVNILHEPHRLHTFHLSRKSG